MFKTEPSQIRYCIYRRPRNTILLRPDVHAIFGQKQFTLIRKPSSTMPETWKLFIRVFLFESSRQLNQLHPTVALQPLDG